MKLHEKELRAVYTDTIIELMTENSNVVCLEADLGKSSGKASQTLGTVPDDFPRSASRQTTLLFSVINSIMVSV